MRNEREPSASERRFRKHLDQVALHAEKVNQHVDRVFAIIEAGRQWQERMRHTRD